MARWDEYPIDETLNDEDTVLTKDEGEGLNKRVSLGAMANYINGKQDLSEVQKQITNLADKEKEDIAGVTSSVSELSKAIGEVTDIVYSHHKDIPDIQKVVAAGMGSRYFKPGDQIVDTWKNDTKEYEVPWDVADHRDSVLESGKTVHSMLMQWHYASPFGVQFSHQRAFYAAKDGLAAGKYYVTLNASFGSNVAKGDIVSFELTKPVPKGGRIAGCYRAPDQTKDKWRIYTYGDGGLELIETVTPTFTADGTNLGNIEYTARNGKLNSIQEMAYGYNRWSKSALRQFLNSDKPKGQWWTAIDEWDIAPDQLTTKDGFLCGMSEDLKNALLPIRVRTALNTTIDTSVGQYEDTYDKVFLPSLEEEYIVPQASGVEGAAWDYWKETMGRENPTPWSKTFDKGGHQITYGIDNKTSAQYVRLRSAYRGYSCTTWSVNASGNVSSNGASNALRFAPACAIGSIL